MYKERKIKFFTKNKKASIGATMTWVVATLAILLLVILFIYSSYLMAKKKEITNDGFFDLSSGKSVSADSEQSLLALLKTKKNGRDEVGSFIYQGKYLAIKDFADGILSKFPAFKSDAFVYIGNKKVELKGETWDFTGRPELKENLLEVKDD
jgi:hypothetical protein